MTSLNDINIRGLDSTRERDVRRVAALDSSAVPRGALLGAEVCGRLVAVLGLERGDVVADPFARTAELVDLLRLRGTQVGAAR
jgi:hypothetical protein